MKSRASPANADVTSPARWRRLRERVIVTGLVSALTASLVLGALLARALGENEIIRALVRGEEAPVSVERHGGNVIAAKALFFLVRDRKDEAQALLDAAAPGLDDSTRARMLFNHANAHVRDAIGKIEKGALDAAIPLVMLAKEQYRQSLRLEPGAWDVKYNFDVAMRLVRDFPGYEKETEEPPADAPKRLLTDLPGTPRGEP